MAKLTHLDDRGNARMVDVGEKPSTARRAVARGEIRCNAEAFEALRQNRLGKGDAVAVARIAGIQAAKRTHEWVPLCHAIPLDHVGVEIEWVESERTARVTAEARAHYRTGVEMEALVAASAACLALYDMAKALDRGIRISDIRLMEKEGGRSGRWVRDGASGE